MNKPYLPLASGEFSMRTGTLLVAGTAALSLLLGVASGSAPLLATLSVSLLLGVLYSCELPFMRWKRSPLLAAGCILAVRAIAVQLGFFLHMHQALAPLPRSAAGIAAAQASSSPLAAQGWADSAAAALAAVTQQQLPPAVLFTLCFMLFFSVVIALFKDIPDALGDRGAGVRTMTVRLGVPRVFWACIWLLTAAYAGAITYTVLAAQLFHHHGAPVAAAAAGAAAAGAGLGGMVGSVGAALPASLSLLGTTGGALGLRAIACVAGHAVLAGLLWQRALRTDLGSNKDLSGAYMHIWRLFYFEYLLIPILL